MEQVSSAETTVSNTPTSQKRVIRSREVAVPDEYGKRKAIFRSYQVIWYILGFIEVILGFRVLFRLFGANPGSPFVALIYGISTPFAAPFRGIF